MGIVGWIGDDKRSKLKSLAAIEICDESKEVHLNEFYRTLLRLERSPIKSPAEDPGR